MTDPKSRIISTQRSYQSRRRVFKTESEECTFVWVYIRICLYGRSMRWIGFNKVRYLVQFRTLFLANWSTDRSMTFLRYICVSYLGTMSTMSLLFDLFATTLNLNWVQLMYVYIISHSFDNKYKQTDKHSKIYVTLTAHKKAHAFFWLFFCIVCFAPASAKGLDKQFKEFMHRKRFVSVLHITG